MKCSRNYSLIGFLLIGTALLSLVVTCGKDSSTPTGPTSQNLDSYIRTFSPFGMPAAEFDRSLGPGTDTSIDNSSGELVCTAETFEMGRNMPEIVAFDPNAGALWPGSLVQGKYVKDGILVPISAARRPITVGIADLSGLTPAQLSRQVAEPTQFLVAGSLNSIVDTFLNRGLQQPAVFTFQSSETYAFEQGLLNLGISASWVSGSVRGQFGYSWSETKHTLLLKFTQKYYTATVEPPASPGAYFATSVTREALAPYVGTDNPPCYVSSVTYGRMGILSITSTQSESAISAAVTAAMNDVKVKGTIDFEADYAKVLDSSEMKLLVLGGSGTDGVVSLTNPVGGLMSWIDDGMTLSATTRGVPISYVVAHLYDNSKTRFQYTTEYTQRTCAWADQPVYVSMYKIKCLHGESSLIDNAQLEGAVHAYLTQIIPGLDTVTEDALVNFSQLGENQEYAFSSATWSKMMPRQAGAKLILRIAVREDDPWPDPNDDLGSRQWEFAYPNFKDGEPACTGEPPVCEYSEVYEEALQQLQVFFKVDLGGN